MSALQPLTVEEQDMATRYLYLVDQFLYRHRLDPNEYYDVAIFGYLEAIQRDYRAGAECPEDKKNFHGLAEVCMKHAIYDELQRAEREMRKADQLSISFDKQLDRNEEEFSLYEITKDTRVDIEKSVIARDLIEHLYAEASPRERTIVDYVGQGFEPQEISKIMGLSVNVVRSRLYRFRLKAYAVAEGRKDEYERQRKEKRRARQITYQ